jgi:hypothetical protein
VKGRPVHFDCVPDYEKAARRVIESGDTDLTYMELSAGL